MNIICGTDFSDTAKAGATAAAVFAHKLNDRLLLVHALPAGGQGAASPEVMNSLFATLHEMLAEEVARLRRLGAKVEPHLVTGYPAPAMLGKALPGEARLVVVGSQGKLASNHRLFSGVGERVAERAPTPTLVVRQAEPFLEWAHGERPLRIVCAYDFSATADAALGYLHELRRMGECDIVVVQVDSPWEEQKRLGIPGPLPLTGNVPEVQAILERELREKVSRAFGEAGIRIRVEPGLGRPDVVLISLANEERADVLVMGTHQWRGLDRLLHISVSRSLLRHAPMSVLVVPPTAGNGPRPAPAVTRALAAVDFSDLSRDVVAHACALLRPGGVLRIVHVIHPRELPHGEYANSPRNAHTEKLRTAHLADCAGKLRALMPADATARGLTVEVEVVEHWHTADGICQAAERFGANVICLGPHGRSGLSEAMEGSVTRTVMNQSPRPLLVVHPVPA